MYKLIIQDDEGKTTVVPLIREELTIGRQEGNTIRLTERNVSRRHAKLLRGGEEIIIEDLDSYNGVRVNGSRIQGRAEIKEADRVQIGDYLIEVKADQPNADAETREIAVITDADIPEAISAGGSQAATVPTSVPVSTPAPPPTPSSAPAQTANGTGPQVATELASPITSDEHANGRLVILSKTMAGREFVLDKPAMVIGRTEENDIWVNHRSISRHHAKVVRENGSYAIVDLQSANGVRVNGEEYGKVELRTRDVVDLGHVRFRFVAPNEDFLFGRDAQPVDIATEGQGSKLLWGAVIVLLLGVGAFFMFGGDDEKDPGTSAGNDPKDLPAITDPPVIDDPPPVPTVEIDAAVAEAVDTGNEKQLATYLKQATASQEREAWSALAQAANKILRIDPSNEQAKGFAEQAALEKLNKARFEKFHQSIGQKRLAKAAGDFAKIDDESVYKVKGQPDHDKAKASYQKSQMSQAKKSSKNKRCSSELARLVANTPPEWSDIAEELGRVKCKEVVATRPPVNNNPDPKVPPTPPTPSGPGYDVLIAQAKLAVKNTQYGKGLKLCRQALEHKPGDQEALMACTIASCNLKNGQSAKKFFRKIRSGQRRNGLKQICFRLKVPGFDEE